MHGWGTACADPKPIKGYWQLTIMDMNNYPFTLEFDIVNGRSPLIIGLDSAQYADTCNLSRPNTFSIRRPQDRQIYNLHTYTAHDDTGNNRLRLQIVPHENSNIASLTASTDRHRILITAKKIHRFGHGNATEMERIMKSMRFNAEDVKRACQKVQSACPVCAATGRPKNRKKISTTHIHSAFNQEIQADYLYATIHGTKYEILNMIDTGTRYGERVLTKSRSAAEMKEHFEKQWFYHHGAPVHFSADHEFCRPILQRFLTMHSIHIHPRPSRSSNKTGRIERNNGVLRTVLDRMQRADINGNPETILARASFITNLIRGSKTMCAFQLARGYMPSVLGIPKRVVSDELLQSHIERESVRALERILRSKAADTIDPLLLPTGTKVLIYHKSSKNNEPNEWVPARVVEAGEHIITCRRSDKGPPMNISHNDIRLMPEGELTDSLMRYECTDNQSDDNRSTNNPIRTDTQTNDNLDDETPGRVYEPNEPMTGSDALMDATMTIVDPNERVPVPIDETRDNVREAASQPEAEPELDRGMTIPANATLIGTANRQGGDICGPSEKPEAGNTNDHFDDLSIAKGPNEGVHECEPLASNEPPTASIGHRDMKRDKDGKSPDERNNRATDGERNKRVSKDIGATEISEGIIDKDLGSDKQMVLRDIHSVIGNAQVTISRMQSAPSWVTTKALEEEHHDNWRTAYYEVEESVVPRNANVISSHVVYKIKTEESGRHRLKARIVPHGNKDRMKDQVRKDSATAQFNIIRLMLAISSFFPMRLGVIDISGAYMQSGPIKRDIYVRPPREWDKTQRGRLWKLTKLPYGVSEAGRQWATVIEEWLLNDMDMERVTGISQLFLRRRQDGSIAMIMAKVTDDLLFAGTIYDMKDFSRRIGQRFKVSKTIIDQPINFNGCRIVQDTEGNITMDMSSYTSSIRDIDVTRNRRKEATEKATNEEYHNYRSMAGSIIWAGNGTLPQAAFSGSYMQQKAPTLRVGDLIEGNKMLKELKDLDPTIRFRKLSTDIRTMDVWTFSDASFNIVSGRDYGQTGIVTGIKVTTTKGEHAFHIIDWASTKQRRITHSSYGAEILACSDADDRGYYLRQAMRSIFNGEEGQAIKHILHVDSRGLFDTISTLHDGKEYRLRQTVQRIRDSFESGDIDVLRWIPTGQNIADGLTKRCPRVQRRFNASSTQGTLTLDNTGIRELTSTEWK